MDTLKILVVSQKGGVGKSTLSANLAVWFSEKSFKQTLLIDLDPHGSSSQWIDKARSSNVSTQHYVPNEFGERRWLIDARQKIRKNSHLAEVLISDLTWTSALDPEFMHEFDLIIVPTSVSSIELSATNKFLENIRWVFEARTGIPPTLLLCPSRVMPYELVDDPFSKKEFPLPFMLLPPIIHDESVRKLFKNNFIIDIDSPVKRSFIKCASAIQNAGVIHKQAISSVKLKLSERRVIDTHNTKLSRYMSKQTNKKDKTYLDKKKSLSGFSKLINSVLSK